MAYHGSLYYDEYDDYEDPYNSLTDDEEYRDVLPNIHDFFGCVSSVLVQISFQLASLLFIVFIYRLIRQACKPIKA